MVGAAQTLVFFSCLILSFVPFFTGFILPTLAVFGLVQIHSYFIRKLSIEERVYGFSKYI
jgi:hypothetical protein